MAEAGRRPAAGSGTSHRRQAADFEQFDSIRTITGDDGGLAGPPRRRRRRPAQHRRGLPDLLRRLCPTPELAAAVGEQAQAVKDALAAWHARYDYYNFVETPAAASAVLPPASYQRLQKIKTSYDPDQMIISAHPVWPTRP